MTAEWGFEENTYSNGAAFADFETFFNTLRGLAIVPLGSLRAIPKFLLPGSIARILLMVKMILF